MLKENCVLAKFKLYQCALFSLLSFAVFLIYLETFYRTNNTLHSNVIAFKDSSYSSHELRETTEVSQKLVNVKDSSQEETIHLNFRTKPPLLVALVVAKKCGSAALTDMLGGHPDILEIPRKVVNIINGCKPQYHMTYAIRIFQLHNPGKIAYLLRENQCLWNGSAFEAFGETKPTRVITMVCDPVHRVLSDYLQILRRQTVG